MNILAIDTAAEKLSVALAAGNDTWLFEANAGLRHSELLMDSVDMLLRTAGLKPEQLTGVVCMGGPGSFTGLRIGFSAAKGLALALGIPFAPLPTLDCLAWPFSAYPGIIVPALDAKKGAFFCALYQGGKQLCPAMDAEPDAIVRAIAGAGLPERALLIGPGAELLREKLNAFPNTAGITAGKGLLRGNAVSLLEMAKTSSVFDTNINNYDSGPLYIRKSDAELNLPGPPR